MSINRANNSNFISGSTVLVTGGTGLVGSAIKSIQHEYPYKFVLVGSQDCDLTNFSQTDTLMRKYNPTFVIHLAANVGGLFANMADKVGMLEKNLLINHNVLKACHVNNVAKVVSCLSTCIFPDKVSYPIDETMLHLGPPHPSNDAYAYAKRMLEHHSKAYQEQHNKDFICVIPTNIYGPHDNFNLTKGHVIPALIHQCYQSKYKDQDFVVKGTGKPLRQFIYSVDLAKLLVWTLESYRERDSIILSVDPENEVTIDHVAQLIAREFKYSDRLTYDSSFSDGQHKKTADNSKLRARHPQFKFTSIENGIHDTVKWFIANFELARR